MEIVISETNIFKKALEAIREFLPTTEMNISSDGLRINGMDQGHICFIDFFLSAEECDTIRCKEPISLGISTGLITKVLGAAATGSDTITLSADDDSDKMNMSIRNETTARLATFELPLLELNDNAVEIPDMEYAATVKAKTTDIAGLVKDAALFGESAMLTLNPDGFHISSEGEGGSANVTLENTDGREMELSEEEVKVTYSIKYLANILRGGGSLTTTADLSFEAGKPLRAIFRFGKNSHFTAYLAPKMTDD
jgi:proliferating cell nuclear antigen